MKQLVAPGTSPGPQPRPRETVSYPPPTCLPPPSDLPAPRPGGRPGQSAETGYTARPPGPSGRPGFPIISPPHQNQQPKAPPVPEPGNRWQGGKEDECQRRAAGRGHQCAGLHLPQTSNTPPRMMEPVGSIVLMTGSQSANVFAATPEEQRKKDKMQVSHINSTGRGAMKQEILCKAACGTCNTANAEHFHPKDIEILKAAREKLQAKTSLKTG